MVEHKKLVLEILAGPLDGHVITLEKDTEWTKSAAGLLAFPWDEELGQPQSRFVIEDGQWMLEPYLSPHGTYILNRNMKLSDKTVLQREDLLKAGRTWMIIKDIS